MRKLSSRHGEIAPRTEKTSADTARRALDSARSVDKEITRLKSLAGVHADAAANDSIRFDDDDEHVGRRKPNRVRPNRNDPQLAATSSRELALAFHIFDARVT